MLRRLWQSAMIGLARSQRLKAWIQENRTAAAMMQRYVAGGTAEDAVATARDLAAKGISVSLFYLGEYVETREGIDEAVREKLAAVKALSDAGLDIHVSVDPTQIGLGFSSDLMAENARTIGKALADAARGPGRHCLMLDMEDHTTIDATLALHDDLAKGGVPVAVTMQAYLKRTESDLQARIRPGGMVRLVKGAFVAGPEIAHVGNAAIKENSRRLIDLMLSEKARDCGFYPVIATHDDRLQDYAIARAEGQRLGPRHLRVRNALRRQTQARRNPRHPRPPHPPLHPLRPRLVALRHPPHRREPGEPAAAGAVGCERVGRTGGYSSCALRSPTSRKCGRADSVAVTVRAGGITCGRAIPSAFSIHGWR